MLRTALFARSALLGFLVSTLAAGAAEAQTPERPNAPAAAQPRVDAAPPGAAPAADTGLIREDDRSKDAPWRSFSEVTRTARLVGDGVAPRAYPFLDSFLYLRERRKDRADTANGGAQLFYDIMRVPFAGGEPVAVAQVSATTQFMQRGAYSPVRWMRVRESTGAFMIEAEGMANTILPDPFATKTEP